MIEPIEGAVNSAQPVPSPARRVQRSLKGRILHSIVSRLFSSRGYQMKQNWWNNAWNRKLQPEAFDEAIPADLKEAVMNGWISPGSKILDIGCGGGELSAWLATQGFVAEGIDFSETAIIKAREWFDSEMNQYPLTFDVVDICKPAGLNEKFNLILDKGCFHGIPQNFRKLYIQNLVQFCEPGAQFMMFIRLDEDVRKTQSLIAHHFSAFFEIESFQETEMRRVAGALDISMLPSLTVKMRRRA